MHVIELWQIFKARLRERTTLEGDEAEERTARERRDIVLLFDRVLIATHRLTESLISKGYSVDKTTELSVASMEVSEMLAVPLEKVVVGHRQVRAGMGRPTAEVRRDLQRRLHA
jgi:hypothetical protein